MTAIQTFYEKLQIGKISSIILEYYSLDAVDEKVKSIVSCIFKQRVFWGLNENWWMSIIDGHQHSHGPDVFEPNEPGYYKGMQNGCEFVSDRLDEELSSDLYLEIHRRCIPPVVVDNLTKKIRGKGVGQFNPAAQTTRTTASHLFEFRLKTQKKVVEDKDHFQQLLSISAYADPEAFSFARQDLKCLENATDEELHQTIEDASNKVNNRKLEMTERIELINRTIDESSPIGEFGKRKTLCTVKLHQGTEICIEYGFHGETHEIVNEVLKKIFSNYESQIKKSANKIKPIAELYQILNWLHPLRDGQGRTTLILLSKELCRHGLNPAILDLPYFANYATLEEWTDYLTAGIKEWQSEWLNPHRLSPK